MGVFLTRKRRIHLTITVVLYSLFLPRGKQLLPSAKRVCLHTCIFFSDLIPLSLSFSPSLSLSFSQSLCLSFYLFPSLNPFVSNSISFLLSIPWSLILSLSFSQSLYISLFLSLCLSLSLSFLLSIPFSLSLTLSVLSLLPSLNPFLCLSLLSISLSVSLIEKQVFLGAKNCALTNAYQRPLRYPSRTGLGSAGCGFLPIKCASIALI